MASDLYSENESPAIARGFLGVFRYSGRAVRLVWTTSRALTVALAALTILAGVLPAAVAFVGARIVDAVVAAIRLQAAAGPSDYGAVLAWVLLEAGVVAAIAAAQRGISLCQSLLRAQLAQRVNVMILEKALTLELAQFEDSEFYDKLTRARREASSRPLSLVVRTFGLAQTAVSLASYAALLVQFSPWAMGVLLLAGLPAFLAEAKFSGDAFRLFRWRSPETRMQSYLEMVMAREDHAKEVKLFELGPLLLGRYREIFERLYTADRNLTIRRDTWGFALGLLGTSALYGAYAWIAVETVRGAITLGQMTMYLMLFRSGQAAVSAGLSAIGGMYEDNLYLSTLYEYLEQPSLRPDGAALVGPEPGDGIRFENVSFTYPGHRAAGAARRLPPRAPEPEPRARRRERLGQDDAHQAADAPLPAHRRAHPARRARSRRLGGRGAAAAHRRDLPGLRALPDARRRERRRRRRARVPRRGALGGGRRPGAWRRP